jgi:hypothetical protein
MLWPLAVTTYFDPLPGTNSCSCCMNAKSEIHFFAGYHIVHICGSYHWNLGQLTDWIEYLKYTKLGLKLVMVGMFLFYLSSYHLMWISCYLDFFWNFQTDNISRTKLLNGMCLDVHLPGLLTCVCNIPMHFLLDNSGFNSLCILC